MDKRLRALAVYKASIFETNDYLESYIPFFALTMDSLFKKNPDLTKCYSVDDILKEYEVLFGGSMNAFAMTSIINRAKKMQLVHKEQELVCPVVENINEFKDKKVDESESDFFEIINKDFIDYCAERDIELKNEEASETILDFIEEYSDTMLLSSDIENELDRERENFETKNRINIEFFKMYILCLHEENSKMFNSFCDLCAAALYSNLIYVRNPEKYKNLKGVKVIFDTPIILRWIGAEGDDLKKSYCKLFDTIESSGGKSAVFSHSLSELESIYAKCLIEKSEYDFIKKGTLKHYFAKKSFGREEIIDHKVSTQKLLEENFDEINTFRTVDSEIIGSIRSRITTEYYFPEENTIDKDALSVFSIKGYREAELRQETNMMKAKYIFVTNNPALNLASKKFELNDLERDKNLIPYVLTDVVFGTFLLICSPDESKIINRAQIYNTCRSLLKKGAKENYKEKIVKEMKKIIENDNGDPDSVFAMLSDDLLMSEVLMSVKMREDQISYENINLAKKKYDEKKEIKHKQEIEEKDDEINGTKKIAEKNALKNEKLEDLVRKIVWAFWLVWLILMFYFSNNIGFLQNFWADSSVGLIIGFFPVPFLKKITDYFIDKCE